jgi:malate dehydrogenase (oxaloacetate-decarboxylating)
MKTFSYKIDPFSNEEYLEVYLEGPQIMNNALLNKGAAYSYEERMNLGLDGFIREKVLTIDEQVSKTYNMFMRKHDDLEKYIFLQSLLNRNETLFYNMLSKNLKELLPIVYTPTVGQACLHMSHILRKFRGIYISPYNIQNIDQIFSNVELPKVYLIVVTDGERILGLGDLGSDGMGIPVGKINLYVAAGGLNPATCLPITLDVGTNNFKLLHDKGYLGLRKPRLDGAEYENFIEKFVLGVKRNFPDALLQWEDFSKNKAFMLMERYRKRILSFNDDIQGTGATALSAIYTALKIKNHKFSDEKYIIVGMGQAGAGCGFNIKSALENEGLTDDEIRQRIFALDINGLLVEDMPDLEYQMKMFTQKREWIQDWKVEDPSNITLKEVVKNSGGTVIIGVTAKPGLFDEEIITTLAQNTERPLVFALSNPTSNSECTAQAVYDHTKGKGLFASGSPFDEIDGEYGRMMTSQCNNMYIFPGVGLGALVSKTPYITHKMFLAASKKLSDLVEHDDLKKGALLPKLESIREISAEIALSVAQEARDNGLGRRASDDELMAAVKKAQWKPEYINFRNGLSKHIYY